MDLRIPNSQKVDLKLCRHEYSENLQSVQAKSLNLHMSKSISDIKIYPSSSFYLSISDMPTKRRAVLGDYENISIGNMYGNTLEQLSWR